MLEMRKIAERESIEIEWQDFIPPIRGIYWAPSGIPPVIWLDKSLEFHPRLLRCVMAEELGHHFTLDRDCLTRTCFNYQDRLEVSRAEYRAWRWAATYLMPDDDLDEALQRGFREAWELADYFQVTEEMMRFRLELMDLR